MVAVFENGAGPTGDGLAPRVLDAPPMEEKTGLPYAADASTCRDARLLGHHIQRDGLARHGVACSPNRTSTAARDGLGLYLHSRLEER